MLIPENMFLGNLLIWNERATLIEQKLQRKKQLFYKEKVVLKTKWSSCLDGLNEGYNV